MSADFFDTNIFVYLFDDASAPRRARSTELVTDAIETGDAIISAQVIQETLSVLSTKLGASPAEATRVLETFLLPLWRSTPTATQYRRALELRARYRYSFYDSLILAAALDAGCDRLLTEDFQHGQRIDGLTIENPFR